MTTKKEYQDFLYSDLIFYLVTCIITNKTEAPKQAELIFDTWVERNRNLVKDSMNHYAKERIEKEEDLDADVVKLLVDFSEKSLDALRVDIANSMKSQIIPALEKLKEK